MEIERKFRLKRFPKDLTILSKKTIHQGYIAIDKSGNEVRVRSLENEYFITIKGKGTLSRSEVELSIDHRQFKELWPLTFGRRIKKIRYTTNIEKYTAEIDVYHGHHRGLITAEIEFPTINRSKKFISPDWLGEDVTDDPRFKNKNLSIKGIE